MRYSWRKATIGSIKEVRLAGKIIGDQLGLVDEWSAKLRN